MKPELTGTDLGVIVTHYMRDYKENVLSITDEEVAADWRMGLLRATGKVVSGRALPNDSTGSYGMTVPGSNRAHVSGGHGEQFCPLVKIYDIEEQKGERYNFDTFGDSSNDVVTISALGTCKCGKVDRARVSVDLDPGELIYSVMNAK